MINNNLRQYIDVRTEDVMRHKLESRGYKNASLEEICIFYLFGKSAIDDLNNLAFRYSCVEADYLKIEKKGKPFIDINKINLSCVYKSATDTIEAFLKHGFRVKKVTEEEILRDIVKIYEQKKG